MLMFASHNHVRVIVFSDIETGLVQHCSRDLKTFRSKIKWHSCFSKCVCISQNCILLQFLFFFLQ